MQIFPINSESNSLNCMGKRGQINDLTEWQCYNIRLREWVNDWVCELVCVLGSERVNEWISNWRSELGSQWEEEWVKGELRDGLSKTLRSGLVSKRLIQFPNILSSVRAIGIVSNCFCPLFETMLYFGIYLSASELLANLPAAVLSSR